jgi:aspartyl-tRNA(Asn)/glutamyl-tRNA(Gln) amidotransferase subunit A
VETSAVGTVQHNLAQIAAHDNSIKANITVLADAALQRATELDAARAKGQWRGLLHGVTVAVKDNIDTAGVRTTSGSKFFADHVPDVDAPVVAKLKAAGAIIISKANMHEFAFGGTTQNITYGACRNPWDTDYIPGGSSGGSGAAVAAEMATVSLGTDTGGSIRLPACINGVVGIRPTSGRVSNHGSVAVSETLDTIGPLAYRAEDVARTLAVIEGHVGHDPWSHVGPYDEIVRTLHHGVDGMRIGIPTNYFFDDVHPDVLARVRAAIDVFASLGAELVDVTVPDIEESQAKALKIMYSDAAAFHADRLANQKDLFDPDVYERMQIGVNTTGAQYADAVFWHRRWRLKLAELFNDVAFIVTPTTRVKTPQATGEDLVTITHRLSELTYGFGIAGVPGVSVPIGFVDGMPTGMQLVGPAFSDGLLLRAATAYQSVTDWHQKRPARLADTLKAAV